MSIRPKPPQEFTFFPVVNFMTGPPGVLRNGGIWKSIKRGIIHELKLSTIMTQVLHFVDFDLNEKSFNEWFKDGKTLKDWIIQENPTYSPILFADSGGFKLLYNREYDLSKYQLKATPESVLDLQLKLGADYVASLDYPIPPGLNEEETNERMEKSIMNAVRLMELVYDSHDVGVFPYLAVHGRSYEEIQYYVKRLFNLLEETGFNEYSHYPFGLAIGSMVPIKNHYELIVEIIKALKDTLLEIHSDPEKIPIHVFGISGRITPFMYYLGVDSFDSNTYVKAAQNLQFFVSYTQKKKFHTITSKDLDSCPFCNRIRGRNLQSAKKILKSKSYYRYSLGGQEVIKSDIYGIIALHNLSVQLNLLEELKRYNPKSREFKEWLVKYASNDNKLLKVVAKLSAIDNDFTEIASDLRVRLPRISGTRFYTRKISLKRDPTKFDITKLPYQISPEKRVILVLACTPEKPYSESRTHKIIFRYLQEHGINLEKIEKVTLSGMYGPVPQNFETETPVLEYDFILSSRTPEEQIDLVSTRLKTFLENHAKTKPVIAYIGSGAYRRIIQRVQKELEGKVSITLLPKESQMRKRVNSEVRKKTHLRTLVATLKKLLNTSTEPF
ncbi:tRNA-guanine transglycosylase [Thermococcus sp. CX2]|uniref:tRNA-guanine transglycosylase n=1 Tax=Thermococcus sp. CX2 TaxID=163006 RepID=UPI0014388AC0|nr:tRNA-guanine transglycosylase [Thermococcus sp. CX2]NJE85805.1 tRNA-guanine transglycosylase [Thermococcus sp. CX2]